MKESNYTEIVMSSEFESLAQPLMVEIVRRRQLPAARPLADPQFDTSGKCTAGSTAAAGDAPQNGGSGAGGHAVYRSGGLVMSTLLTKYRGANSRLRGSDDNSCIW